MTESAAPFVMPTTILAIDPGTTESGYLIYGTKPTYLYETRGAPHPGAFGKKDNFDVRWLVKNTSYDALIIEMIASYGMAVGKEVFETVLWVGRFIELARSPVYLLYRAQVKSELCKSQKASDANVRCALVDLYGGEKAAKGKKGAPGPLYGVANDVWSALALAITATEMMSRGEVDKLVRVGFDFPAQQSQG